MHFNAFIIFKSKVEGNLLALVALSFFLYSAAIQAEPQFLSVSNALLLKEATQTQLQVKPAKCVALNEGRTCYAKVIFSWQSAQQQPLCIYQKNPKKKIACWQHPNEKAIAFDFQANQSRFYQLINHHDIVLAETMIEVNWVYDSGPRKRRWRVF